MYNTIIMHKGERVLTEAEYKKFTKGDTIINDGIAVEIKRWPMEKEEEAKAELAKHPSSYKRGIELWYITEYGLEYCETDKDGKWVDGSDYDIADEE